MLITDRKTLIFKYLVEIACLAMMPFRDLDSACNTAITACSWAEPSPFHDIALYKAWWVAYKYYKQITLWILILINHTVIRVRHVEHVNTDWSMEHGLEHVNGSVLVLCKLEPWELRRLKSDLVCITSVVTVFSLFLAVIATFTTSN